MIDKSKLKELALAAQANDFARGTSLTPEVLAFMDEATPAAILELLAELEETQATLAQRTAAKAVCEAIAIAAPAVPVPAEQGWISVEDARRPEKAEIVLVAVRYIRYSEDENGRDEHEGYEVTEGEYMPKNDEGGDYFTSFSSPHGDQEWVTHWMPLPAAPSLQQGKEPGA